MYSVKMAPGIHNKEFSFDINHDRTYISFDIKKEK